MQTEHNKHNESIIKACDEANKKEGGMVYTQEMKDNGELPKVGMRCRVEFAFGDVIDDATILLISENGVVYRPNVDGEDTYINTINSSIIKLLPYKAPEEIKQEEAKKKQLEDMCFKYKNLPLEVAMQMQANGDLPEIVLDDLSARGMAKE